MDMYNKFVISLGRLQLCGVSILPVITCENGLLYFTRPKH